jgi:hypothetical protein
MGTANFFIFLHASRATFVQHAGCTQLNIKSRILTYLDIRKLRSKAHAIMSKLVKYFSVKILISVLPLHGIVTAPM